MKISLPELKKLVKLANHLDSIGLHSEADTIDSALTKYSAAISMEAGRGTQSASEAAPEYNISMVSKAQGGFAGQVVSGSGTQQFLLNNIALTVGGRKISQVSGMLNSEVCSHLKSFESGIKAWGRSNNPDVTTAMLNLIKAQLDFNMCNEQAATRTPPKPRPGACIVKIPDDTLYVYDYDPATDTFSVISGLATKPKFGKGHPAYEKLMKEGEGTCIPRETTTQPRGSGLARPGLTLNEATYGQNLGGRLDSWNQGRPSQTPGAAISGSDTVDYMYADRPGEAVSGPRPGPR